jgi:hypothetical protein
MLKIYVLNWEPSGLNVTDLLPSEQGAGDLISGRVELCGSTIWDTI